MFYCVCIFCCCFLICNFDTTITLTCRVGVFRLHCRLQWWKSVLCWLQCCADCSAVLTSAVLTAVLRWLLCKMSQRSSFNPDPYPTEALTAPVAGLLSTLIKLLVQCWNKKVVGLISCVWLFVSAWFCWPGAQCSFVQPCCVTHCHWTLVLTVLQCNHSHMSRAISSRLSHSEYHLDCITSTLARRKCALSRDIVTAQFTFGYSWF